MLFPASLLALAATLFATSSLGAPQLERRTSPGVSTNQTLINELELAPTGRDRIDLLPNDLDFVYDFNLPPTQQFNSTGKGGSTIAANRKTFPALIGTGSSMTVGFMHPCGMNTPHTHPRGTELNIVVQGALTTAMVLENGVRAVMTNTTLYQMTVFPQGALHMEFNPLCTPTVFIAGFNNEDAGTQQTLDAFVKLPTNVIEAAFGGEQTLPGADIDKFKTMIPANIALGVEECLARCNIPKNK
ncbi:MAG: hypothetical protein M1824_006360 [Vezdaea acicularis]|nr:MAG: hypothetical protein M1824_006360 [Vezdaea acicularis]